MTVAELVEILKEKDQNRLVLVDGYEGGLDDPSDVEDVEVALDVHTEYYYGKHEDVYSPDSYPGKIRALAVVISR